MWIRLGVVPTLSDATVSDTSVAFGCVSSTEAARKGRTDRQTDAGVPAVLDVAVEWSITEKVLTLIKGDRGLVHREAS